METYRQKVDDLFGQGKFPDVKGLFGGQVIIQGWMNEYTSANDVLQALEFEMAKEPTSYRS